MTLRKFVLALVIVPLVALVAIGGFKASTDFSQYRMARKTQHETDVALNITTMVHYLQAERSKTIGYLTVGSSVFGDQLKKTRTLVDGSRDGISDVAKAIMAKHISLASLRDQVDVNSPDIAGIKAAYTGLIVELLDEASTELMHQRNPDLVNLASGLVVLNTAKESASIQRAAGLAGFGDGGFDLKNYTKFAEKSAEETKLLHQANNVLHEFVPGLSFEKGMHETGLDSIRASVIKAGPMGPLPRVTAIDWFDRATNWTNYLHAIEDDAAKVMVEIARSEARTKLRVLIFTAALVAISAAVCAVLGLTLMRTLTEQLGGLQKDLDRLAQKDFNFVPTFVEAQTEIGQLSRSMDQTRKTLEAAEDILQAKEKDRSVVIEKLGARMARMAERDLNCTINTAFPKEYEALRDSFNLTVETLAESLQQVVQASSSIHSGASEVSQAADDLSHRTESQAATLEETAAALEELVVSVASSAEGARRVEAIMGDARQEAENSGEVVQNAVGAMNEIEQSSEHIAKIIGVIDDIAFQTNLLALNAGVEAARAGEAGRGFAVVASEVRALAQRSADAATEIKTLIGESSRQVRQGVDLVGRAGDALHSIVEQVNHISALVSDIANGSSEQSTGLNEINLGVTQLDQVTQQNAAMVEQTTAAGHLLASDAQALSGMVQGFILPNSATALPPNAGLSKNAA